MMDDLRISGRGSKVNHVQRDIQLTYPNFYLSIMCLFAEYF